MVLIEPEHAALTEYEAKKMLSSYGISVPGSVIVEGENFVPDFDGPYAVKVSDPSILHKTEVGGVIIGLRSIEELQAAISEMRGKFPSSDVMVEQMVPEGVEIITGIIRDPQFGLVIMAGLGGVYAELIKDRAFRLVPISLKDARSMILQTKLASFVDGFRGMQVSLDALAEFIASVSRFAFEHRESLEGVDLNPVIANGSNITVADAKIIMKKRP